MMSLNFFPVFRFQKGSYLSIIFSLAIGLTSGSALNADTFFNEGKRAFAQRNYRLATELFQKALSAEPSNGNPLFYLGYILENQGDRAGSVEQYKHAIELRLDQDLREKSYWKIILYYKYREDWDQVIAYCDSFLKYRDTSDIRRLREQAEKSRETSGSSERFMTEAARKEKEGDINGAMTVYRDILGEHPDHQAARWRLTVLLMDRKDYQEADTHLERLIRLDPASWEFRYKSGVCRLNRNLYQEALDRFAEARKLNDKPNSSFLYFVNYSEGLANIGLGQTARAADSFAGAIQLRRMPAALGFLARTRWLLGQRTEAQAAAEEALRSAPDQEDALNVRCNVFFRSANRAAYSCATRLLQNLERNYPSIVPAYFTEAMFQLMKAAGDRQDWEVSGRALARIDEAGLANLQLERIDTKSFPALAGRTLLQLGKIDESLTYLERSERTPENAYLRAKAFALKMQGDRAKAALLEACSERADCWNRARLDPAFTRLASGQPDFQAFLKASGKTPAPVPSPQPQSNTNTHVENGNSAQESK